MSNPIKLNDMKKIMYTLAVSALFLLTASGVWSEARRPYFATHGAELTYVSRYDGKEQRSVSRVGAAYEKEGRLHVDIRDDGKMKPQAAYYANGVTYYVMDLSEMLSEPGMDSLGLSVSGATQLVVDIPAEMEKGQKLSDLSLKISMDMSAANPDMVDSMSEMPSEEDIEKLKNEAGIEIDTEGVNGLNIKEIDFEMHLINRKCLGYEDVTVSAGEFRDCVKLIYTIQMKVMFIKTKIATVTEWYAPGVGLVKSETETMFGGMKQTTELAFLELSLPSLVI